MIPKEKYGVHKTHCCAVHGCKYGDEDCPVATLEIDQEYLCEDCHDYFQPSVKHVIHVSEEYANALENEERTYHIFKDIEHPIEKGSLIIFRVLDSSDTSITKKQYLYVVSMITKGIEENLSKEISIASFATRYGPRNW